MSHKIIFMSKSQCWASNLPFHNTPTSLEPFLQHIPRVWFSLCYPQAHHQWGQERAIPICLWLFSLDFRFVGDHYLAHILLHIFQSFKIEYSFLILRETKWCSLKIVIKYIQLINYCSCICIYFINVKFT